MEDKPANSDLQHRGKLAYHSGLCAEESVERAYEARGHTVAARRWRGKGGEIDLILKDGEGLIFVEVKKSKSFAKAAERVSQRQIGRLYAAASEYMARMPRGQDTDVRFDVALVDGSGAMEILENAFI